MKVSYWLVRALWVAAIAAVLAAVWMGDTRWGWTALILAVVATLSYGAVEAHARRVSGRVHGRIDSFPPVRPSDVAKYQPGGHSGE